MRARSVFIGVVALACGSRAELDGAPVDAATEVSAGRCDPNAPFVSVERLDPNINALGFGEASVCLTSDELHAYFSKSDAFGVWHVEATQRASPTAPFDPPTWISSIETLSADAGGLSGFGPVSISDDERTLFFLGGADCLGDALMADELVVPLCVATRADAASSFSAATTVHVGSSSDPLEYVGQPYALRGGSRVYFLASAPGNALRGIAFADRVDSNDYGPIVLVPFDFGADAGSTVTLLPVVTPDELTIFFLRSNDPTSSVWQATRNTTTDAFANARPLPELSGAQPSWVSPNGCRLYMARADTDGGHELHLYVAHRAE